MFNIEDIALESFQVSVQENPDATGGRIPLFIPITPGEVATRTVKYDPASSEERYGFLTMEAMMEYCSQPEHINKYTHYLCRAGFWGIHARQMNISPYIGKIWGIWKDRPEPVPAHPNMIKMDVYYYDHWGTDLGFPKICRELPFDCRNSLGTYKGIINHDRLTEWCELNFDREDWDKIILHGETSLMFYNIVPVVYRADVLIKGEDLFWNKVIEFGAVPNAQLYPGTHAAILPEGFCMVLWNDQVSDFMDKCDHTEVTITENCPFHVESLEALASWCRWNMNKDKTKYQGLLTKIESFMSVHPSMESRQALDTNDLPEDVAPGMEALSVRVDEAEPAMEAMQVQKAELKKSKIINKIVQIMDTLDPTGDNGKRYRDMLEPMSIQEFTRFMNLLKEQKYQLNIVMPNMVKTFKMNDIFQAAKIADYKIMHQLWLPDPVSGRKFLTNEKYMVLQIPIRRAQQEVDKKLSVPQSDVHIDALTGQVTGPDKACSISTVEMRALHTRGLSKVLEEFVRVRGGDLNAYGDFKRQLEETGEVAIDQLDPSTRSRASVIAGVLFRSVLLENNI